MLKTADVPELRDLETLESPALLFIEERIDSNLQHMLQIVEGDPARLRPHVKTHKTPQIIQKCVSSGITQFKAATLAEAELCASHGAADVLVAYPLQGPAQAHLLDLQQAFPQVRFSTLVDSPAVLPEWAALLQERATRKLGLFLELDCGMGRTGISPGRDALELYAALHQLPHTEVRGFHAYDGHLHEPDVEARKTACEKAFEAVLDLRGELRAAGFSVPTLVAGGSPTFALHASHPDRECSPGTTVLWDFGYGDKFPDLPFECAAWVLTRVVSKPAKNRLCLDLGHKAIAPEMPHPRVRLAGLENAPVLFQSEEHLVLEVDNPDAFSLGQPILGLPRHICPTVSMYNEAIAFRNGSPSAPWSLAARGRRYQPERP
jgi:D-serine deaminase-like pyridoxal phosphate-dependent protein